MSKKILPKREFNKIVFFKKVTDIQWTFETWKKVWFYVQTWWKIPSVLKQKKTCRKRYLLVFCQFKSDIFNFQQNFPCNFTLFYVNRKCQWNGVISCFGVDLYFHFKSNKWEWVLGTFDYNLMVYIHLPYISTYTYPTNA